MRVFLAVARRQADLGQQRADAARTSFGRVARRKARIGSATMSRTRQRGLSEAYGSWKIMFIRRRMSGCARAADSVLALEADVAVAAACNRPTARRAMVDLPQPDSPTSDSVVPRGMANETSSTARSQRRGSRADRPLQQRARDVEDSASTADRPPA